MRRAAGLAIDLHVRILFLQISSYAAGGAAGPHRSHKYVYLPLHGLPDLRPRSQVMGLRMMRVFSLCRAKCPGYGLDKLHRFFAASPKTIRLWRQHHLGAISFQDLDLFLTGSFGHAENGGVIFHCTGQCHAYPGVAGASLHNGSARLKLPLFFRDLDHVKRRPVLDASARIKAFHLCI